MGIPSDNPLDTRKFEHFAKVNDAGHVVAMVAVAEETVWKNDDGSWSDGEGNRYVYLTDLLPLDIHGMQLLPPKAV